MFWTTQPFKFINKLFEFVERFKNYNSEGLDEFEIVEDLKIRINEVSENIESFQFNKSVAKIYEFVNILNDAISKKIISKDKLEWSLKKLSVILQPFVPHINERWVFEEIERKIKLKIAVQINGKTKEIVEIDDNLPKEIILDNIKNNEKIKKNLFGKKIIREIYVPGKIINLVVG